MTQPTWADCAAALPGLGSFSSHPGDASEELAFDAAVDSPPFIDGDGAPVSLFDFAAAAASVHRNPAGNSLSRSAIYGTQPLPAIPEPHTNLLMLAGLAAIGFMATRRRRP